MSVEVEVPNKSFPVSLCGAIHRYLLSQIVSEELRTSLRKLSYMWRQPSVDISILVTTSRDFNIHWMLVMLSHVNCSSQILD